MKQTYIRCPRCELNYILKKDKFCNVCKLEMKALGSLGADENMDLELCPVCKINYINPDEDICTQCAKEREMEDGETDRNYGRDDEWSAYANGDDDESGYDDDENGDMVSITNLDDTPLGDDDDMDLGISDDEEDDDDTDDVFDGEEDDDDFDDLEDDEIEEDDDDFDDEPLPSKKKKKS